MTVEELSHALCCNVLPPSRFVHADKRLIHFLVKELIFARLAFMSEVDFSTEEKEIEDLTKELTNEGFLRAPTPQVSTDDAFRLLGALQRKGAANVLIDSVATLCKLERELTVGERQFLEVMSNWALYDYYV
jgi:hypothetical protein